MMETPSTAQALARVILQLQADAVEEPATGADAAAAALHTFSELRAHLVKLVGVGGYQALLARACVLARRDAAWLMKVSVDDDAALERFALEAENLSPAQVAAGSEALLGSLLGLLFVFIGEGLTEQIARDIWPGIPKAPGERAVRVDHDADPEESGK